MNATPAHEMPAVDRALDAIGSQPVELWPRLLRQFASNEPLTAAMIDGLGQAVADYPGAARRDFARLIAGLPVVGPAATLAETRHLARSAGAAWHPLDHTALLLLAARLADATGDRAAAGQWREEAIAFRPFGTLACSSLAGMRMPGPNYLTRIVEIAERRRPASYVEIGIAQGRSLESVRPTELAIAIDPQPRLATIPPKAQVFAMTSDVFFAEQDLGRLLGGRPFDLAFVDGQHHHEQVLKDLRNLERFAGPDSIVLLHDTLPVSHWATSRPPTHLFWTGDVWRAAAALAELRPDLALATIACRPSGLTVLRGLAPRQASNEALWQRLGELAAGLQYPDYQTLTRLVRAVPNDEQTLERLLA